MNKQAKEFIYDRLMVANSQLEFAYDRAEIEDDTAFSSRVEEIQHEIEALANELGVE